MAALDNDLNEDDLIVERLKDIEWLNDVSEYKCTRCGKVLVQHFIANCEHKYCFNCKRLLADGSHAWKCTNCNAFIIDMERQDPLFEETVGNFQLHCPNQKYGCKHACLFKELKEHLRECPNTREAVLPRSLHGEVKTEMMDMKELKNEIRNINQKIDEMEIKNKTRYVEVDKNFWDLSVEEEQLNRTMLAMEKKRKWKLKVKLSHVNDRIDGVKSDLNVETTRIKDDITELQKSMSLTMDENKSKILKLEGKVDAYLEIVDLNNRKNNELMHQLTNKFDKEFQSKIDQVMNTIAIEQEKWAEVHSKASGVVHTLNEEKETREEMTSTVNQISSEIITLTEKIESLGRDLQADLQKLKSTCANNLKIVVMELQKNENALKNVKSETENLFINLNKKIEEMNNKIEDIEMTINQKVNDIQDAVKSQFNKDNKNVKGLTENYLEQKIYHLEHAVYKNSQITCADLFNRNDNFHSDFIWENNEQIEAFTWKNYPVQTLLHANEDDNTLGLEIQNFKQARNLKFIPHIYYVVKNYNGTIVQTNAFHAQLNTLNIEIYVEPPLMAQHAHSYNGTLNWIIDDCRKRSRMEIKGLIEFQESPYFFTGPRGYRVQASIWLHGYGDFKREGLTVQISFLTGEFDDDLTKDFPHQMTITLFNQKEPQRNITKTVSKNIQNEVEYFMDVCDTNELENTISNDCLFCKVVIKPIL